MAIRFAVSAGFRYTVRFITLCFILLAVSPQASARLIGVVFDDSASMANTFLTPLHALQLLVASLKEGDRMFVVKMSNPDAVKNVPDSYSARQEFIIKIGRDWRADGETPFESVVTALHALDKQGKQGEEIKLIVLTDGEFTEPPADPAAYITSLKQKTTGKTIDISFVAISRGVDTSLLDAISLQGVRKELLRQFNGDESVGKINLQSAATFLPKMADLIATVHGSDPGENVKAIRYQGNIIEFTPPFAINELTIISSGVAAAPAPKIQSFDFKKIDSKELSGKMREPDGISSEKISSSVLHLTPWPQLSGGNTYKIVFDRTVDAKKVRLIFNTSVVVDWALLNDKGTALVPDSHGIIRVGKGESLVARAKLYDYAGKGKNKTEIDLNKLPHQPVFTLQTSSKKSGSAKGSSLMKIDLVTNAALGDIVLQQKGRHIIAVRASYPGFLDLRPKDINVEVVNEIPIKISLSSEGGSACQSCQHDSVDLIYTSSSKPKEVLLIKAEVATNGFNTGTFYISLNRSLPSGVKLLLPDGSELTGSGLFGKKEVKLESAKPFVLKLIYNKDYQETSPVAINLTLTAKNPWKGTAQLLVNLVPQQAKVTISPKGHTMDPSGQIPFQLLLTDIHVGEGLYFAADGLEDPLDINHLQVTSGSMRAPVKVVADKGSLFRVIPVAWGGCDCFTASGTHNFTISYNHPLTHQKASLTGEFTLQSTGFWVRCWQEILLALLLLLVLAKIFCYIRTHRFPGRSKVLWIDDGYTLNMKRLHRSFRSFLLPFCGCEQKKVFGLTLRATAYGVELLPAKGVGLDNFYYNDLVLSDIFKTNGNKPIPLYWVDKIEDRSGSNLVELQFVEK